MSTRVCIYCKKPGHVAQSVARLTQESEIPGSILGRPHTFVPPSADSRRAVVSYLRTYVHEVLVNRLGGLSLPRKSVVRLTDRPDMTLDVYRGRTQLYCTNKIFRVNQCSFTWHYILVLYVIVIIHPCK